MKMERSGQAAVTDYKARGNFTGSDGLLTWLELQPHTGRTHQLRVHCAALGCPVMGDQIYGKSPVRPGESLMLHARAISLPLYPNRKPIEVIAPSTDQMLSALSVCGFAGDSSGPKRSG
jgi:23S rRNA-/tRNA-specific pseudouridylate synthase